MNDAAIEQEIQRKGLTAPRVTPQRIESVVAGEYYFTAENGVDGANLGRLDKVGLDQHGRELSLMTFCVLVLTNGFKVSGESVCTAPENYDAELGRKIARQNAVDKIWPLEGYLLKDRLARQEA